MQWSMFSITTEIIEVELHMSGKGIVMEYDVTNTTRK